MEITSSSQRYEKPAGYPCHSLEKSDLEFEKTLQQALGIMTKKDIGAYVHLSNCIPNCPQFYGIARTNSFGHIGKLHCKVSTTH